VAWQISYAALRRAIDGGHLPVIDDLVQEVPSSVTFHVVRCAAYCLPFHVLSLLVTSFLWFSLEF
jgi:hypothetical protein